MSEEFDDYEIQEGCTVQPETKDELITIIQQAISDCGSSVDLNFIDTSKITNMNHLFAGFNGYYGLENFNGNISKWNVSNVTNMAFMFSRNRRFNQPLNDWDVSNVTNMLFMFSGAKKFNQPLNNWDVSNVTKMKAMFSDAKSFNQSLAKWNISNVKDMSYMFDNCPIDYRNLPNQDYNIVFVEAAIDDPELLKTSGKYIKFDRIWKVPKQDFNNDNLELINKLCFKTFDDVLACTPMSKSELTKFILTNQNELSKKQQIDNKQLNSKNRSINR